MRHTEVNRDGKQRNMKQEDGKYSGKSEKKPEKKSRKSSEASGGRVETRYGGKSSSDGRTIKRGSSSKNDDGVKKGERFKDTAGAKADTGLKKGRRPEAGVDAKTENRVKTGRHYSTGKDASPDSKKKSKCPVYRNCGGCQLLDMTYEAQLELKQMDLVKLLKPFCEVHPISGMENPYHYRNKVHAVFDHDGKGNPISGVYKANSHEVIPVESCLIEDQKADEIIGTIRGMLKSFKIRTFDEDTGYGLLRHVLVKRGFATGEIMVVLVTASPVFPSKNNFVAALREKHPEITTMIQNVNNRSTSMVLGDKEKTLFGKGYIEDVLCGCTFRISSKSFYQVNPVQTEVLYNKAIQAAGLTGKETVIDAYCGIGTIGIIASKKAGKVIGIELNKDAVKDAWNNARRNEIKNVEFYCNDAGTFMVDMAEQGEPVDVVFMDPPRGGSTEAFMDAVAKMKPGRVVYVSCNPMTLERDLRYFKKIGYEAKEGWGVDMFPWVRNIEVVIQMTYCGDKRK